jgi:hypothetical protein
MKKQQYPPMIQLPTGIDKTILTTDSTKNIEDESNKSGKKVLGK